MRDYEIATILNMDKDESGLSPLTETIESWIAVAGGEVAAVDNWGRRKLAYPIKKQQEGHYVFWYASLPPTAPVELERQMRLNEYVLRFMVIRAELPSPSPPEEREADEEEQGKGKGLNEDEAVGEAVTEGAADAVESANSDPELAENDGAETAPVE